EDASLLALGDVSFGKVNRGADYEPLPESGREVKRVLEAFGSPKGSELTKDKATVSALLARLPEVSVAHLATHGYFDEKSLQAEAERAERMMELWKFNPEGTRRTGLAAKSPLGFVGLALAGANEPKKADQGGIVTGLSLLELPLGKMRLCVLSA